MKKIVRNMSALLLLFFVASVLFGPVQVFAAKAKTTNLVMYIGEAYDYTNYSEVKSIKNTKKTVVSTSKSEDGKHVIFTAKKTGKSKITVKTASGTMTMNITVKKASFTTKLTFYGKGNILVSVKNNTKSIFESGKFRYVLKGSDGTEYASDLVMVNPLLPGKESFAGIYYNASAFEVDLEKSTLEMETLDRSPSYTYKDGSKNLTVTDEVKSASSEEVNVSLTLKNSGKATLTGEVHVVFYDPSGAPIDLFSYSVWLKEKAIDTKNPVSYLRVTDYSTGARVLFDSYKIYKNVYIGTYK